MIRLSVTDLDQYLYWLELDDGPEWLIDRLTVFDGGNAAVSVDYFSEERELQIFHKKTRHDE